jgi:hypothetical protein
VRHPPVRADGARTLRTTYLEIDQVPDRRGVILSKPAWCWGAEMGINDAGVAIGNEAIFSRLVSRRKALLGMDLVRISRAPPSAARCRRAASRGPGLQTSPALPATCARTRPATRIPCAAAIATSACMRQARSAAARRRAR